MKKLLVLLPVFLFVGIASVIAQPPAGGGQGGGQFREQMKQRYKDSLRLTDAQIDTVFTVQQEFRPQQMAMRDVAEADRPAKMKELNAQMAKRLGASLKDEALAQKIMDFQARNRGRGRQGGGNN